MIWKLFHLNYYIPNSLEIVLPFFFLENLFFFFFFKSPVPMPKVLPFTGPFFYNIKAYKNIYFFNLIDQFI